MLDTAVYLDKLALFGRILRQEGMSVSPNETEDACRILLELGFADREQVREYERARDIAIVTAAGYPALDSFPHALRDTYRHFCEATGQKPQPAAEIRLEGLGWQVHRTPPPPVPGAWEMLACTISNGAKVVLLTPMRHE